MREGGNKREGGSNLVQTKQSLKHKALQSCKGSPTSPRCSPGESTLQRVALPCALAHTHTHTHTHARTLETLVKCLGLGGGLLCGGGDEPRPPLRREGTKHARPPPGTGGK